MGVDSFWADRAEMLVQVQKYENGVCICVTSAVGAEQQ